MELEKFIAIHNVEHTKNLIDFNQIKKFEDKVGISFGKDLVKYVVDYGYLAYKSVELYGINLIQLFDSDMIKQTIYLHHYFPKTQKFVALENQGDGDYYLVDSDDQIFEYLSDDDILIDTKLNLFQYILKRFQEA